MTRYSERFFRNRAGNVSARSASESLRTAAKSTEGPFDIFLSHSFSDAQLIFGIREWLVSKGLSVYVDWIDDPELDRDAVSYATAARLRKQMDRSRNLLYATSRAARTSRWMPWELGYFDGRKGGERVSILALDNSSDTKFAGEEYLSLYKRIEQLEIDGKHKPYAIRPTGRYGESLKSFGLGWRDYRELSGYQ